MLSKKRHFHHDNPVARQRVEKILENKEVEPMPKHVLFLDYIKKTGDKLILPKEYGSIDGMIIEIKAVADDISDVKVGGLYFVRKIVVGTSVSKFIHILDDLVGELFIPQLYVGDLGAKIDENSLLD